MNYFAFSALINLITSSTLFIMMMAKSKRTRFDNWFAGFLFSTMIWSLGYFFWQISTSSSTALFWTRFLMGGAIIVGLTYLQFVLAFLGLSDTHKKILRIADITYIILFVLNFGPWIVSGVESRLIFPFWPIPGSIFHAFLIIWGLTVIYSTYLLYQAYTVSKGLFNRQIRLLFFGMGTAFIAGSTNYFLWYNIPILPVANIIVTIYPLLVFYAIVRYKFSNIKVIATEIFVMALAGATVWQFLVPSITSNIFVSSGFIFLIIVTGIFLVRSVIREVEQREQLEKLSVELSKVNEQLKILDQARAEFITIASHQLRTPPATIKWYLASIIDGDYGKLLPQVKDQLQKTMFTNNSMIALIDDLLNASRIERGKMEFNYGPTDLLAITETTIEQLRPQAEMKKLDLIFRKPKIALPIISADKEKLRQVINNFIDNAIKYTQQGKVEVELSQTKTDVMVKVTDTGRGVARDQLGRVFEKFDRGKTAPSNSTGLGLGLYVAKVVVEQHKGKIWVESKGEGQGSSFIFTIPIKNKLENDVFDLAKGQKAAK